jgi:hypothetical protein
MAEILDPSGYLEGTRTELIRMILTWAMDPDVSTTIKFFVLLGAAGTGKSTIAREISRRLRAANRLGASIFFDHSDHHLRSTHSTIPRLAYQLAALNPASQPYIEHALREHTRSPSGTLNNQMESLIVGPMKNARVQDPSVAEVPVTIVLDALDEAGGDLNSFLQALNALVVAQFCFRIFMTTRPEPPVLHALSETGITRQCMHADMEDTPQIELDADIRHFLQERIALLRWRNELLAAHPYSIELLTMKAEGLFIYARTVVDYLDHPVQETSLQRLDAILRDTSDKVGLPALDVVYTTVLQNAYDKESLKVDDVRERVTALLAGLVVSRQDVTIEVLAPLMGPREGAIIRTVEELRSILSCSGEDLRTAVIRPLHQTLVEFLVDDKRCTNSAFLINRRACHLDFAKACLRTLNTVLYRGMCERNTDDFSESKEEGRLLVQELVPAHALYACDHWTAHLIEIEQTNDPALLQSLDDFCRKTLFPWIEVQCYADNLLEARRMLSDAHSWAKVSVLPRFGFSLLNYDCVQSGTRRPCGYFEHSARCTGISGQVLRGNTKLIQAHIRLRIIVCASLLSG